MTINHTLSSGVASLSLSPQPVFSEQQETSESLEELLARKMPSITIMQARAMHENQENAKSQADLNYRLTENQKEIQTTSLEIQDLIQRKSDLEKELTEQTGNIKSTLEEAKPVLAKMRKCCEDTVWISLQKNNFRGSPNKSKDLAAFATLYSKKPAGFVTEPLYVKTAGPDLEKSMIEKGMVIDPDSKQDDLSYSLSGGEVQPPFSFESFSSESQNNGIFFNNTKGINRTRKFLDIRECIEKTQNLLTQHQNATVAHNETVRNLSSCVEMIKQKEERLKDLQASENIVNGGLRSFQARQSEANATMALTAKIQDGFERITKLKNQLNYAPIADIKKELCSLLMEVPDKA